VSCRVLLLAAGLVLAGCTARREAAIDRECRAAEAEYFKGRLPEAQKRIEACERRWSGSLAERDRWRLRLLRAGVLVARAHDQEALPLVEAPLPPADWAPPLELRRQVILARIWTRGKEQNALDLLDRAEAEARRLGDRRTEREIAVLRGNALMSTRRLPAAEASLNQAADAARDARDDYWLSGALANLSVLKSRFEFRYDEAARLGEQAIQAAQRAGAERFLGAAYGNTSLALEHLGEFDGALNYRREALKFQRRADDQQQVRESLGEMGNLLEIQDRPTEAAVWYRQAFEDSERAGRFADAARSAGNLARTYISQGIWDEAETWNRRAVELKTQSGASLAYQTYNAALIATGRNRLGEAQRLYRQLLEEAPANPGLHFEAETGLGRILARTGAAGEARRHFESAVRVVESNRDEIAREEYQITFQARMIRAWGNYVDFLMARGQPEAALEMAERSRAQVLAAKLRARNAGLPRGVSLARLRQIATRRHCTLLSYWLGPEQSYAWIVDASGLRTRSLPPARAIDLLAAAWRRRIEEQPGDPLETGRQAGDRLASVLLEGLPPGSAQRLVIVPDGSLHQLNLETLPVPGQPRYLLDDATIVVSPSLAVFAAQRAGPEQPAPLSLLVGAGRPGDPSYPPLPNAEQEVRSIASHCAENERVVLLGSAATPAALRKLDLRRFGVIHFAAHAEANRESPLDSAVILAREGGEYKLYAREMAGMPIQAGLVTLSACRTAGARAYSGEGLLGLAWAVLSSGARNVVAGLWPASDRATLQLMEDLYAGMRRGLSPPSALREAKLAMRRSQGVFREPFYWAPFQVYVRGNEF
jgi:tetratricopeptide (TPR) repeat protein